MCTLTRQKGLRAMSLLLTLTILATLALVAYNLLALPLN